MRGEDGDLTRALQVLDADPVDGFFVGQPLQGRALLRRQVGAPDNGEALMCAEPELRLTA